MLEKPILCRAGLGGTPAETSDTFLSIRRGGVAIRLSSINLQLRSRIGPRLEMPSKTILLGAPGEVQMKTGTPWPMNAPPPWGARAANESDDAYRRRVIAWAEAHPPTEPVD